MRGTHESEYIHVVCLQKEPSEGERDILYWPTGGEGLRSELSE